MLIKLVQVLGWITVTAGAGIALICVGMLLNRSPSDTEGMIVGAAIGTIVLVGLPTFVAGLTLVAFANRKAKSGAT